MAVVILMGLGLSLTLILWMAVFDYWPTVKQWWRER